MSFSLEETLNYTGANQKVVPSQTTVQAVTQPKVLKLKSAGYSIGKQADNCEDAFFVSERGFGVADGVSGWNDYGFSSHAFSNQLMDFCRSELENCDREAEEFADSKKNQKKSKRSFVNLEDLDDGESQLTFNNTSTSSMVLQI